MRSRVMKLIQHEARQSTQEQYEYELQYFTLNIVLSFSTSTNGISTVL